MRKTTHLYALSFNLLYYSLIFQSYKLPAEWQGPLMNPVPTCAENVVLFSLVHSTLSLFNLFLLHNHQTQSIIAAWSLSKMIVSCPFVGSAERRASSYRWYL